MDWLIWCEVFAAVVVVVIVASAVWMIARSRWLGRRGGMFECRFSPPSAAPQKSAVWLTGFARYDGNTLQWFRAFSLWLRPAKTFDRLATVVKSQRMPDPRDAGQLLSDDRVVELRTDQGLWQLAMTGDCLTGLLSWLEAAPPGARQWAEGH